MSKAPNKQPLLKDNGEPLIANDTEAETVADAIESDAESLAEIIKEKGWQEAIDTITSIQEGIDALSQFLADKE